MAVADPAAFSKARAEGERSGIIPTSYKGYRFRSRTEARWAVFFDAYRMRWEYARKGYPLSCGPHLPNFWMFDWNCWIETKREEASTDRRTARELRDLTLKPVILAVRSPSCDEYATLFCWRSAGERTEPVELPATFVVTQDGALAVIPDCLLQRSVTPKMFCNEAGCELRFLTTLNGTRSAPMSGYLESQAAPFEFEDAFNETKFDC